MTNSCVCPEQAAVGFGFYVNANKTKLMCFKQEESFSLYDTI